MFSFKINVCLIFKFYFRERDHKLGRGTEEKGQNLKQTPYSAQSPTQGSIPWPWDHDLSWNQELDSQPTEPLRQPCLTYLLLFFFKKCIYILLFMFVRFWKISSFKLYSFYSNNEYLLLFLKGPLSLSLTKSTSAPIPVPSPLLCREPFLLVYYIVFQIQSN